MRDLVGQQQHIRERNIRQTHPWHTGVSVNAFNISVCRLKAKKMQTERL